MNLKYQIESHAMILRRWFSPSVARRRAAADIKAGRCWLWPEPTQLKLDLEGGTNAT